MGIPPEPVRQGRRLLAASIALGTLVLVAWVSFILGRATAIPMPAAVATDVAATTSPFAATGSAPGPVLVATAARTSTSRILPTTRTSEPPAHPTISPSVIFTSTPSPLIAATSTATPTSEPAPTTSPQEALEIEMIDEINRLRRENGCDVVLQRSVELTAAARTHSRDMAENHFFDHRGSDGSDRISRAQAAGYVGVPSTRVRENIGAGPSPGNVLSYWLNLDAIHRNQLLDCTYNDIGVGYAIGDGTPYTHYWTVNFGVGPR
jgi:uncharacterized protein YkwD